MDELGARRLVKEFGSEDPRVTVNAYGEDGFILIDAPVDKARELRDELIRILGE